MALFHPELVKLGTSSYSLIAVLDQTVDLVLNLDGLWSIVDTAAHYTTETSEWIFTRLPK